jgi:catalase (peroxidase I)
MTRDMGPVTRCLGPFVPPAQPFQMPLPAPAKKLADFDAVAADVKSLIASNQPAASPADRGADGKPTYAAQLAQLAAACAGTYRATDYAGGCNGARIRFAPQKDWPDNKGLDKVLKLLEPVKSKYGDGLSWADLIVLAGTTANEQGAAAPKDAFSFCPGRTDAPANGPSTAHLEPRKYINNTVAFKDNAAVRGLTLREAVALAGGLRSDAQLKRAGYSGAWGAAAAGPLSNAFFKALLDNNWSKAKSAAGREEYHTRARLLGGAGGTMTPDDVAIKQDPELAAIAKEYAADNAKFLAAYAAAWTKAMNADRFDGPAGNQCSGTAARAS